MENIKYITVTDDQMLLADTTDYSKAHDIAEQYVYGMGGTCQVLTFNGTKLSTVVEYYSDGWEDDETSVEITKTYKMEGGVWLK